MADTDIPGKRTATSEGFQAKAPMTVLLSNYDVIVDCGDFRITLTTQQAHWLAAKLSEKALAAGRARRDAEPEEKSPWLPGLEEQ